MCARYYIDDFLVKQVEEELDRIEGKAPSIKAGDVHPSERAPVLVSGSGIRKEPYDSIKEGGEDMTLRWESMDWGFQRPNGKGLIINGRSETVREKYTFRDCFANRRCVIPARAFYEWDERKEKVTYSMEDGAIIYLAGIYEDSLLGYRFVVLTTDAPEEVSHIHDRVPLIFRREQVDVWINDESSAVGLLHVRPPRLLLHREYEQQRFSL